jgi:predicted metal-dependent phosphoesterase TrpH
MKADLHIHSLHSNDGEYSIPEIIKFCIESGVDTFSITDHNCVGGSREAMHLATDVEGVNFIPGIEIDCNFRGTDLHLLGYQVNLTSGDFDALMKRVRQRHRRGTSHRGALCRAASSEPQPTFKSKAHTLSTWWKAQ